MHHPVDAGELEANLDKALAVLAGPSVWPC